jgi:hypothetical protein
MKGFSKFYGRLRVFRAVQDALAVGIVGSQFGDVDGRVIGPERDQRKADGRQM